MSVLRLAHIEWESNAKIKAVYESKGEHGTVCC